MRQLVWGFDEGDIHNLAFNYCMKSVSDSCFDSMPFCEIYSLLINPGIILNMMGFFMNTDELASVVKDLDEDKQVKIG